MQTIFTTDTYEASFYILFGAKLCNVSERVISLDKAKKKGYAREWSMTLCDVPYWAQDTWRTDNAYGNISAFVKVRRKLKKQIRQLLERG